MYNRFIASFVPTCCWECNMTLALGDVFLTDIFPDKKNIFDRFIVDQFIPHSIFRRSSYNHVFSALRENGVDRLELFVSSNAKDEDLQKVDNLLEEFNMSVVSIHQPLDKLFKITIKEVARLVRIANKLKAKVLVLHINVMGDQIFDRNYIKALRDLESEFKIKIGIENMPINPFWFFKTYAWKESEFSTLVAKVGFNVTFDTTHLAQTGGDIVNFYQKNINNIVNIQLSDYKKNFLNNPFMLTYGTHLPLGKGKLPIKKFLKILKETHYSGIITMEINGTLEELCASARIIKTNINR